MHTTTSTSLISMVKITKNTFWVAILALLPLCAAFAQAPCSSPAGVRVASILSAELSLAWDASNTSAGSKIKVAWAVYPTSNFIFKTFDSGTSGIIEDLKPDTKYIVRVSRLCSTGSSSNILGLGTLRTLSKEEEKALCAPQQSGDICKMLELVQTGSRGGTYIDIHFPEMPAAALAAYPNHSVTVRFRPLDQSGTPVGVWQSETRLATEISDPWQLSGLTANTLYQLIVKWETFDAAGTLIKTCDVSLNNTPTMGENYVGPVFTLNLPDVTTLDCSTPEPVELIFPYVSGGCTAPHISYTDVVIPASSCQKQILRTWLAVDDCGRSSSITQTIVLVDSKPPVFVDVPANDATIACGENLPTEAPNAVDNCSAATMTYAQQTTVLSGCTATITRTWTATDACSNSASYQQTIHVIESLAESNDEDDEVPPLPVNCGQAYTPSPITNNTPLPTAEPGQNLSISGFPAKLKTVSGSNGNYSGRAKVRLPFGNKVVYCDFSCIQVNTDKQVTQGTLIAVSDPNFVMPDTGSVNFGGDICLPQPPALAAGFNEDGEYIEQPPYDGWQPGDPIDPNYDPNGFDANGYNFATGTKYNAQGCNQQGLDSLGNICNPGSQGPYYWLHNNNNPNSPTTPEGIAYAADLQQNSPNIRELVLEAINLLLQTNQTALSTQRTTCGNVRTALNAQIGSLDRKFFFGDNDIFFKEDMNLSFTAKPLAFQQNIPDRSTQIVAIEDKHIELYYCDKLVYKFKQIDLILNEMKTPLGLDMMVPEVLEAIKHLTQTQIDEFKADPNKLKDWIRAFIDGEKNKKLQEQGLVMVTPDEAKYPSYLVEKQVKSIFNITSDNQFPRTGTMMASADQEETMRILAAQNFKIPPEELHFEYEQGFEYVGGIHRAFYLDAIAKARDLTLAPPGDDDESLLPIRIEKEVGGRTYTILLDQITFTPTGGTMNAYFILDVPNSGQKIVFRAQNIPFTPGGLTSTNAKLSLVSDVGIRLNNAAKLIIKGANNNTYVEWDCNGFKKMGIKAEVEFCREYLIPLDVTTLDVDPDQNKHVKAYFIATMPAWGEFVATLTMDKFALTRHPDYKWEIVNASLDFSETENPPNFTGITPNYLSEFGSGSSFSPQWKGFFLERLKVTLPKSFSKNSSTPISIMAEKLIIDDRGLTGLITVNVPVLSLNNGNLDGWAYSIDQLSIAVVANKIQGGGFGGKLHIPLFKDVANNTDNITAADCFSYNAKIIATPAGELYEFAVTPSVTPKKLDIMVGTAILDPSSFVKVTYANNVFTIISNLSGSITIDGKLDTAANTILKLPSVRFEGVRLSNQAPYFRGGTIGISGTLGASIGGFGLEITGPQLINGAPMQSTFLIGAAITLVGDTEKDKKDGLNFGASTVVKVFGELKVVNQRQIWKYKDYEVQRISINASFKGVNSVKGTIDWYKNDPVFGRGFRGRVSIQLAGLGKKSGDSGGLGIDALAQFGKKDDYKYFFIDALARFGAGQVNVGGLDIRGIGGGVYYHMNRDTNALKGMDQAPNAFSIPDALGVSLSGIQYFPSDTVNLGIKFSVIVALPKEEVFNAGVTLEIRFNSATSTSGAGIKDIALYGSAQLMAPITFGPYQGHPTPAAPVSANVSILFDFFSKTLHGELGVFADVEGAFVGAGPNNSVGKAVIHLAPDKWYINVGTPTQPLGIKLKIPVDNAETDIFEVKTYLCIGTGIPPMPPLPGYVSQMAGATNFLANESRRATGKGFAMGANLAIATGELEFLIFYGHLNAGLGFDVMLQQYEGITCANNNNKPLGINGWYAAGQAWSYLDAELGVKWRNKHFIIMKIGAAAALQIKLPNPFWARGAVGGEYKILGGLVKGKCNFKFTLGKNCDESAEDDVTSVKLIEELNPSNNAESVEVNTKPTAYFGVPVNSPFTLYNNAGDEVSYTATITNMKLLDASNGSLVNNNSFKINADNRSATFKLFSFLPGNTDYIFIVTVSCVSNGTLVKEEKDTVYFTTAASPRVIPPSNVRTSYPQNGMYNFYKNEWAKGYIDLIDGQPDLFQEGQFAMQFSTKLDGIKASMPIVISSGGTNITFDIPANLVNNTIYKMELVKLAQVATPQVSGGASRPALRSLSSNDDPAEPIELKDRALFTIYFRTSQYNKFFNKIDAFRSATTQGSEGALLMYRSASNFEPFDRLEVYGIGQVPSLLSTFAGSSAFTDSVNMWYTEMKELAFVPHSRLVTGSSLVPTQLIATPSDTSLAVTIDMYEEGTQAVPGLIKLEYRLFSIFNYDFFYFKDDVKAAIQMECEECCTTIPCTFSYGSNSGFPPGSGSQTICLNGFNGAPSYNCANLTQTCCCCSSTNTILANKKLKPYVYGYIAPKPLQNTTHPLNFAYRLPNGTVTTPASPATVVNFKYQ